MTINDLPAVNTALNASALLFMLSGYVAIKMQKRVLHNRLMVAAIVSSAAFLTCYLIYHFLGDPKSYDGAFGFIYYPMLISHILLAILVPFLVGFVVIKARANDLITHRKWARIALPIWIYVSATGILVYVMVHA